MVLFEFRCRRDGTVVRIVTVIVVRLFNEVLVRFLRVRRYDFVKE